MPSFHKGLSFNSNAILTFMLCVCALYVSSVSRHVPLVMKQDLGMPLLDLMLNGRDLSGFSESSGINTAVEGLQLIDVQNPDGISHFLGKLVVLDPTSIDGESELCTCKMSRTV